MAHPQHPSSYDTLLTQMQGMITPGASSGTVIDKSGGGGDITSGASSGTVKDKPGVDVRSNESRRLLAEFDKKRAQDESSSNIQESHPSFLQRVSSGVPLSRRILGFGGVTLGIPFPFRKPFKETRKGKDMHRESKGLIKERDINGGKEENGERRLNEARESGHRKGYPEVQEGNTIETYEALQREALNVFTLDVPRSMHLVDFITLDRFPFYFVPQEFDYKIESEFVAISSIGRNNPFYNYTGSQDRLSFTLDWYSREENRQDVIRNCKRLEALSKANSYREDIHPVQLVWGDGTMWGDTQWLLANASYKLSQFNAYWDMLPQQAFQEIELIKIADRNTSYEDIKNLRN